MQMTGVHKSEAFKEAYESFKEPHNGIKHNGSRPMPPRSMNSNEEYNLFFAYLVDNKHKHEFWLL